MNSNEPKQICTRCLKSQVLSQFKEIHNFRTRKSYTNKICMQCTKDKAALKSEEYRNIRLIKPPIVDFDNIESVRQWNIDHPLKLTYVNAIRSKVYEKYVKEKPNGNN